MYRSVKMVILHQMFDILLFLIFCESANALECPIDKTCDSFWKQLLKYPGHNLKKALKCLEYDENISPMEALGNKSVPQEIFIDVLDMNVLEINQERQYGIWGYKLRFNWYDHRYGNMGCHVFKWGVQHWKDFTKGNYSQVPNKRVTRLTI